LILTPGHSPSVREESPMAKKEDKKKGKKK